MFPQASVILFTGVGHAWQGGGHVWQWACMVGGMYGGGMCGGEGGMCGRGVCVAGGMHGGGMHGRRGHGKGGMHGRGGIHGRGECTAGEMATGVDGTHPTGMHSCFFNINGKLPHFSVPNIN